MHDATVETVETVQASSVLAWDVVLDVTADTDLQPLVIEVANFQKIASHKRWNVYLVLTEYLMHLDSDHKYWDAVPVGGWAVPPAGDTMSLTLNPRLKVGLSVREAIIKRLIEHCAGIHITLTVMYTEPGQ